jgi:hypothetical protein
MTAFLLWAALLAPAQDAKKPEGAAAVDQN